MATNDEQSESTFVPRKRRPARLGNHSSAAPASITKLSSPGKDVDDAEEDMAIIHQAMSGPANSEPDIGDSNSLSSRLTNFMSGILKQTEAALEDLLPVISEIDSSAEDIKEQINQKRELAMERRATLDQTRERFQQAANSVLEMLGLTEPAITTSCSVLGILREMFLLAWLSSHFQGVTLFNQKTPPQEITKQRRSRVLAKESFQVAITLLETPVRTDSI